MTREPLQPIQTGDHVRGAIRPTITIVEYGDFACPHTRSAQGVLDRIVARTTDVRIVFRFFPLREIHPNADLLARLAEAAALQDKFWPMYDLLMRNPAPVGENDFVAGASDIGVDLRRLRREIHNREVASRIQRDVVSGTKSGVHSTPSFFFEGALHDGHYDYATLTARLAAARTRHLVT